MKFFAQLLNYLKATNKSIGLLINFTHPKAQIKRLVGGTAAAQLLLR